ncbi:Wzz/FepE/Etk N-terminal domain-containing protein [Kitasatospora sp. NPDC094028]
MTTPRRSARRLVRRWWPVVLAVPLGAAAGAGYAVVSHPSYAASAYVLVVAQNPGEAATATNFAQAYGRLAGQPQVLAVAAAETGHSRADLESLVHGTTSPDAPMIEITGTGTRPQEAAQTADAVARALVSFANTSSRDTNVRLVTLAPAAEPDKPTTPSGKLDIAVGGAAGLLLGALVMMTRRRSGADPAEAVETPGTPAAPETQTAPAAEAPSTPRPRGEARPAPAAAEEEAAPEPAGAGKAAEKPAEKPAAKDAPKAGPKTPAKEKTTAGSGR